MGNCSSSKSAKATEPAKNGKKAAAPVEEPKTLLTNDGDGSKKSDSSALDLLKKYLVDATAASESDVREALEGLPIADKQRLAYALSGVDAPLPVANSESTVHKALGNYLDDARVASASEIQEALQGLSTASQQRLAAALDSLLAVNVQPVTAVEPPVTAEEIDTTVVPEDIEAQAKTADSLAQGNPPALEPVVAEAQPSNTKGWLSCCNVPAAAEFDVIPAGPAKR